MPDARAAALYAAALPADGPHRFRLHAGPPSWSAASRVADMASAGRSPSTRSSASRGPLRLAAERAAADSETLDHSGLGDLRIDTDALAVGQTADLISRRWQDLANRLLPYLPTGVG